MRCSRATCDCKVDEIHKYEQGGRAFCSEMCAKECTDDRCVCSGCDCPK
jgi:hypothetical protein